MGPIVKVHMQVELRPPPTGCKGAHGCNLLYVTANGYARCHCSEDTNSKSLTDREIKRILENNFPYEWPSGLNTFRQVTEVKLDKVDLTRPPILGGWVTSAGLISEVTHPRSDLRGHPFKATVPDLTAHLMD